jgi:hypothetical protein
MLKKLKFLIYLVLIFFSQHIFSEEKNTQGKYIGHLVNVTEPSFGMHTKFGAGGLLDILGFALSDKEKKAEQANKLISNEDIIKIYTEEIKKLLLASGKFKAINTFEPNLKYVGKDEGNDPIDKWFGERIIFGDKKGDYFQNPNFREDQEILIEYGLDHIHLSEHLDGRVEVKTYLLTKVIDKDSGKLIVKDQCDVEIRGYSSLSIHDSFSENGWVPPQKCISSIFNVI